MGRFLGDDQVRRVKAAIDLVQLVSEYTPLRKAGRTFTGCCPFHQERTPSFHVYPDDQHYYCFGCKVHGDAVTLVREKENVSFADAVELLARRAGIVLEWQDRGGREDRGEREAQLAAMEFATAYYERMLREDPSAQGARDYLARRGLRDETVRGFRLGWAPGRGAMTDAARAHGIRPEVLQQLDLAVDRHGRLSDRFYERITFPICDRFGHVLGFSARLLPEAEKAAKEAGRGVGKYVNSTDTPLYHKGSVVYGLHHGRVAARDKGRLIVMEGPTDVMAAHQAGFTECVAVLGTALTPEHAKQLGATVGRDGRLILLLDGDRAGQDNALKGVRTCLAAGVPVRVAILPDELDPCELLADGDVAKGREVLEGVIRSARADVDHLLAALAPRPHALEPRDLLAVADRILESIRPVADPELRGMHLDAVARHLGLPADRLERRLGAAAERAPERREEPAAEPVAVVEPLSGVHELAMHLLVRDASLRGRAADELGIEPSDFPAPWSRLAAVVLAESPDADLHRLVAHESIAGDAALREAVHRWHALDPADRVPAVGDRGQALAEAAAHLRRTRLRGEVRRLESELLALSKAGDVRGATAVGEALRRLRMELAR